MITVNDLINDNGSKHGWLERGVCVYNCKKLKKVICFLQKYLRELKIAGYPLHKNSSIDMSRLSRDPYCSFKSQHQ